MRAPSWSVIIRIMNESPTPENPEHSQIRISDAERDAVANRLREAFAEGRLDADEHTERLDKAYGAKTAGELVPLLSDLPDSTVDTSPRSTAPPAKSGSPAPIYGAGRIVDKNPTSRFTLALMSGSGVSGSWTMPATYVAAALMGGVEIDLREANFTARESTIHANAIMGGIEIFVPDDVRVRVHGIGIMGGYGLEGEQPSVNDRDAPIVNIVGIALMGAVEVRYAKRKHQKRVRGKRRDEIEE